MDQKLKDTVMALNPWLSKPEGWTTFLTERLPPRYIPRVIEKEVAADWAESDLAHLVVGPRQAGKSTLIWKHLSKMGPRVLFLTMEDPRIRSWCDSAAVFTKDLKDLFGPPGALFLDEVQHHEEAGLFVKGVMDLSPGCAVFVTGSSSYHLRSRTRESLAGRATRSMLLPFCAAEVAPAPSVGRAAAEAAGAEALEKHVRFGGYPRAWTGDRPEKVLDDLVEAFLVRDASDFFMIRRPDAMRRLLGLMAAQIGSLVNVSEWASVCGISRDTVLEYVQIAGDAHLVELLPVYAAGKRAELTAARKVFFVDNGIRNAIAGDFRPPHERVDAGALWENWVYSELKKRAAGRGLYYWRTKSGAEVDFVADTGAGLIGFEVKATALGAPRLSKSSRSFIDAYAPRIFCVLNGAFSHTASIGASEVRWLTFASFAREIGSILSR